MLYPQSGDIATLMDANWITSTSRYGSLETKYGQVDGDFGVFLGAKGGIVLNDTYSIGLAGYFLFPKHTEISCFSYGHHKTHRNILKGGYGGTILEYTYSSSNLFHFTVRSLFGVGGIRIEHDHYNYYYYYYHKKYEHPTRAFFIVEPSLSVNMNLTRNFKTTLGLSYRQTPNTSLKYKGKEFAKSSIFEGISIDLGLLFSDRD